tara:strand:- start:386 stop:931 length:546 start_codon:yes stop_codon:yes gene_type:complete
VNKSTTRKNILRLRKKNYPKNINISFDYLLKILKSEGMKGKTIGGYYPYNYEIDVIKILEKLEKKNYLVSLPKIKKNFQMNFFKWSTSDPLIINKYGIPEPSSFFLKTPDILLVPLVAFDEYLNRIGYGGGYYDRYINKVKKHKKIITIGLAYSFQKVKKISTNKHDMKLDHIVTEKIHLR